MTMTEDGLSEEVAQNRRELAEKAGETREMDRDELIPLNEGAGD